MRSRWRYAGRKEGKRSKGRKAAARLGVITFNQKLEGALQLSQNLLQTRTRSTAPWCGVSTLDQEATDCPALRHAAWTKIGSVDLGVACKGTSHRIHHHSHVSLRLQSHGTEYTSKLGEMDQVDLEYR